jgi:hypothetical protein
MAFVIKSMHDAEGNFPPEAVLDSDLGLWLRRYDPNAYGGNGMVEWTPNRDRALKFADAAQAWECCHRPSRVKPLRPDGKPNRPITTFSLTIENIGAEKPSLVGRAGRAFRDLMNALRQR